MGIRIKVKHLQEIEVKDLQEVVDLKVATQEEEDLDVAYKEVEVIEVQVKGVIAT